jgi:hypothetical protein
MKGLFMSDEVVPQPNFVGVTAPSRFTSSVLQNLFGGFVGPLWFCDDDNCPQAIGVQTGHDLGMPQTLVFFDRELRFPFPKSTTRQLAVYVHQGSLLIRLRTPGQITSEHPLGLYEFGLFTRGFYGNTEFIISIERYWTGGYAVCLFVGATAQELGLRHSLEGGSLEST